jgi:LPS-assembly lipoprotein
MSSSDASKRSARRQAPGEAPGDRASRRSFLRALTVGLAGVGLAGCEGGFKPLYGSLGSGPSVVDKMAEVDIALIPGRNGQRIRNELIFKSYGGGSAKPSRYRLEVAIKESATTTLVLRDGTSAGQIYQIDAKFQLLDIATKKVLLEGQSQSRATSERFANVYSNVRAGEEAQERAARTIATDLKARIAGFLSTV